MFMISIIDQNQWELSEKAANVTTSFPKPSSSAVYKPINLLI